MVARISAAGVDLSVLGNSIFAIVCPSWPCQTRDLVARDLAGTNYVPTEEIKWVGSVVPLKASLILLGRRRLAVYDTQLHEITEDVVAPWSELYDATEG